MTLLTSLGMYDHPQQRWANDAIWSSVAQRLRAQGIDATPTLAHDLPVEAAWRHPDLLLAQCCGYPLVADADLALRVVAMPLYAVPDCRAGQHVSRIIVRADGSGSELAAFRGGVAAINASLSNTGTNLFRDAIADIAGGRPFFSAVVTTGSHRQSLLAVRAGAADVAAIDAVTYAALARYEPDTLRGLKAIGITRSSPTLPFVTARSTPKVVVAALRDALAYVSRDPELGDARRALFLAGIVPASIHRYVALRALARSAAARGYPRLQ